MRLTDESKKGWFRMLRKIMTVVIVMVLCASSALASEIDWGSMTEDEIRAVIAEAQDELAKRAPVAEGTLPIAEGTVLIDQGGILVTLTGKVETMGTLMELEVIVENNSNTPIYVNVTGSSINGWEVFGAGIADIGAGKKKKGDLMFTLDDASINSPSEIEELELTLSVADADSWSTIFTADTVTLVP